MVFVIYRIFKRLELKLAKNSDELWGHIERRYNDNWQYIDWKTGIEFRITESETSREMLVRLNVMRINLINPTTLSYSV